MKYFSVMYSDYNKVEKFLNKNKIYYEEVNSKNVIRDDDEILEDASTESVIAELSTRNDIEAADIAMYFKKSVKKDIIANILGLNHLATVNDICQEIIEQYK